MTPEELPILRIFAPEQWGAAEHFARFYSESFAFKPHDKRAVTGVGNHFFKACTLHSLAVKLRPNLDIDRAELEQRGFTPALNATEFSAVIEAAILELYSSVDCTAKVIHAIYAKEARGFKDSTRRLFTHFDNITGVFPDRIKDILRAVTWYEELRFIRDELTHRATGSCSLSRESGKVRYMHTGIKRRDEVLIIEDIFEWLEQMMENVNLFLGAAFFHLNGLLKNTPILQVCGMVQGRMLMRYVNPAERLTFDSGECFSYQWFEHPENPTCPFVDNCGAYQRKRMP